MPLAALDMFGGIVADGTAVAVGLDALAVEHGGGGTGWFALCRAAAGAQASVKHRPRVVGKPLPKEVVGGLPRWKVDRQQSPWDAAFEDIEDGIYDPSPIRRWSSAFTGFGEQGVEVGPLGVREIRGVSGNCHRPKQSCAHNGKRPAMALWQAIHTLYFIVPATLLPEEILKPN